MRIYDEYVDAVRYRDWEPVAFNAIGLVAKWKEMTIHRRRARCKHCSQIVQEMHYIPHILDTCSRVPVKTKQKYDMFGYLNVFSNIRVEVDLKGDRTLPIQYVVKR